jgi:hypothetical protein
MAGRWLRRRRAVLGVLRGPEQVPARESDSISARIQESPARRNRQCGVRARRKGASKNNSQTQARRLAAGTRRQATGLGFILVWVQRGLKVGATELRPYTQIPQSYCEEHER